MALEAVTAKDEVPATEDDRAYDAVVDDRAYDALVADVAETAFMALATVPLFPPV